jgi:ubiquinone/menaquinone biosynthesis C-methylase UbiE
MICSPGRDGWQRADEVVAALRIQPVERIADLGAGTGYFTTRLARATGPTGIAYAVDTDEDMLHNVEEAAAAAGLANIRPIHAQAEGTTLPERVDLVFLCNIYHHLPEQRAFFIELARQLAPDGKRNGRSAVTVLRPIVWRRRPYRDGTSAGQSEPEPGFVSKQLIRPFGAAFTVGLIGVACAAM